MPTGDHGIAIDGNVQGSILVTGNGNTINYFPPEPTGRRDVGLNDVSPGQHAAPRLNFEMMEACLALQKALSGRVGKDIDDIVTRMRRGDAAGAEEDLRKLPANAVEWPALPDDLKARVFRLLGLCRLGARDVAGAEEFADDADRLPPPDDEPRLRALIARDRAGPSRAVDVLGEPKTRDGVHLRAALLLEAGNVADARQTLFDETRLAEPDAETWRLRAMLALMEGDRPAAVEAIENAEALGSDRASVQYAAGIVRHAFAVSRAVSVRHLMAPNPIDLDLVREDRDSRSALDAAVASFTTCLDQSRPGADDDRRLMETWRLAALAGRRARQSEAGQYAADLLHSDITHWGAIAWSLARGFPLDVKTTLGALQNLLGAGSADVAHLALAVLLHLVQGKPGKARKLFSRHAPQFTDPADNALLDQWRDRLFRIGRTRRKSPPILRLHHLLEKTDEPRDGHELSTIATALAADPETLPLVLNVAKALAGAGRWDALKPHIDILVGKIGTAEALRVAIYATVHLGASQKALEILRLYQAASGSETLPLDLQRLRVEALQQTGNMAAALSADRLLSANSSTPSDLLAHAELNLRIGNLHAAASTLRTPSLRTEIPPQTALGLSQVLQRVDPELSLDLFNRAVATGIPDQLLPTAFAHGMELAGASAITSQLGEQFLRIASTGNNAAVRRIAVAELPGLAEQWRHEAEQEFKFYLDGKAPIHTVTRSREIAFAASFLLHPSPESPLVSRMPLMIRHGNRPPVTLTATDLLCQALHIDVTALLLADGLALLDVLDTAGISLTVPRSLPATVLMLERSIASHQPDRITAWNAIKHAVLRHQIGVNGSDADSGVRPPSFRVVHTIPEDDVAEISVISIPLRGVVDALRADGKIDAAQYDNAVQGLAAVSASQPALPGRGALLSFADSTIEVLAAVGLLPTTLDHFHVQIEQSYLDSIVWAQDAITARLQLAEKLRRLRERVADHLADGRWPMEAERSDQQVPDEVAPIAHPLLELVSLPADQSAVLWIDDRWANGHPDANGHPIVSITDVLAALHQDMKIDDAHYFGSLLRLRQARAHFVPATAEEVLYHLAHATVENERIIETPALATIRRSIADALLLEDHWELRPPFSNPGPHGELPLALRLFRFFDETLSAIWQDTERSPSVCRIWSDWARASLWVHGFDRIPVVDAPEARRQLIIQSLTSPLPTAFACLRLFDDASHRRVGDLMAWTNGRLLTPAFDANPGLDRDVADTLKKLLLGTRPSADLSLPTEQVERIWKANLGRFVSLLPERLRTVLHEDEPACKAFGLHGIIEMGGKPFDPDAFWSAIALLRGGSPTIHLRSIDDGTEVRLSQPTAEAPNLFRLEGGLTGTVPDDPAFDLLDESLSNRRHALQGHPEWFDYPPAQRAAAIEAIVTSSRPADRMTRLDVERSKGIAARVDQWWKDLMSGTAIDFSPPPASILLGFLRFSPNEPEDFGQALDASAQTLLAELSPIQAARRLGGLPMPPRPSLIAAFAALAPAARDHALADLAATTGNPVGRIHAIALMRHFGHMGFAAEVDRLLATWSDDANAFLAVLEWTEAAFTLDQQWRSLPAPVRLTLVWAHAHLVTDLLIETDIDRAAIRSNFVTENIQRPFASVFVLDPAYEGASAFPGPTLSAEALLLHGLSAVVGQQGRSLLTETQRQRIETMMVRMEAGQPVPSAALLTDRRNSNNALGSYFVERPIGILEADEQTGWELVDRARTMAMGYLGDKPDDPGAWGMLFALALACSEEAVPPDILALLDAIDVAAVAVSEKANSDVFLRIVATLGARQGERARIDRIFTALMSAAADFANRYPSPPHAGWRPEASASAERAAAVTLLEALRFLSRRPVLADAITFFADGLHRFADVWPASASFWREVAEFTFFRLPIESAAPMWKTWLTLRRDS